MDEYLAHLELFWKYFPYFFYTFVLLTFLPKSLRKIKQFADADYELNRRKYHRCYGPELCCHNLIEHEDAPKSKPRKAVSRGYLRKQQSAQQLRYTSTDQNHSGPPLAVPIKRQVQVSAIQTNTNVNQIAKMFESGSGAMAHRKINRVLPEIRTTMHHPQRNGSIDIHNDNDDDHAVVKSSNSNSSAQQQQQLARFLLHENIENSMNLLHQQTSTMTTTTTTTNTNATKSSVEAAGDSDENWQPAISLPRRTRAVPSTLSYAGTSATPSTASPAASSSPHSSPSPPNSPILRGPLLNLKTSVEDIFAAIARSAEKGEESFIFGSGSANTLSPVTSIDDILSQRRLSRPLSAYSISDLLNDESSFNKTNNNNSEQHNGQQHHQHQDHPQPTIKDENHFVENLLITTLN